RRCFPAAIGRADGLSERVKKSLKQSYSAGCLRLASARSTPNNQMNTRMQGWLNTRQWHDDNRQAMAVSSFCGTTCCGQTSSRRDSGGLIESAQTDRRQPPGDPAAAKSVRRVDPADR